MKVLVDTNLFLDVLLAREEFVKDSQRVLDALDAQPGAGWLSWHTLSNLYYVGLRSVGEAETLRAVDLILSRFEISPVSTTSARFARKLSMKDFEDALQVACACEIEADYIVTRNLKDFKKSPVPAVSPKQLLNKLQLF